MEKTLAQNVIVLSASTFIIKNDKTGEVENTGCTVRYAFSEDLAPKENAEKTIKGHRPAKISLPFEEYAKFPTVPALYEAEIDFNVDSQGKAAIAAKNFKFLNAITVSKTAAAKVPKFGT
jgi:hypothetical protein